MFDCLFRSDKAALDQVVTTDYQEHESEQQVSSSILTAAFFDRLQYDKSLKFCMCDVLCYGIIHINYQIVGFLVAPHVLPDNTHLTCDQQWCTFLASFNVMTAITHGVVSFLLKKNNLVEANPIISTYATKYPLCYLGLIDLMLLSCTALLAGLMTLQYSRARGDSTPFILFTVNYTLDISLSIFYFGVKKCFLSSIMQADQLQSFEPDESRPPLRYV